MDQLRVSLQGLLIVKPRPTRSPSASLVPASPGSPAFSCHSMSPSSSGRTVGTSHHSSGPPRPGLAPGSSRPISWNSQVFSRVVLARGIFSSHVCQWLVGISQLWQTLPMLSKALTWHQEDRTSWRSPGPSCGSAGPLPSAQP